MLTVLSSLLLCLPATGAIPVPQAGLKVTLSVVGDYARATDEIKVKLDIDVETETEVAVALLTGHDLEVAVNGKKVGKVGKGPAGKVALARGTHLALELPVDLPAFLLRAGVKTGDQAPAEVTFAAAGVSASLKVLPDLKDVAVEDLDLEKTRVALVTNFGTMVVGLRPDKAPKTVANFVKLAKDGFYDRTRFHRVIRDFMIQGGDPNSRDDDPTNDGTGGPGYQIDAEFNDIKHERGVLSMARGNDPNSAGSQFFVVHGPASYLDNQYTAFGTLVEGLDALDRICGVDVERQATSMERSRPTRDVWLYRAVVLGVKK